MHIQKLGFEDDKIKKIAEEILGSENRFITGSEGYFGGVSGGPYNDIHRILRVIWRETTSRLFGKNKIDELIKGSVEKVCEMIDEEMHKSPGMLSNLIFALSNLMNFFEFYNLYNFISS